MSYLLSTLAQVTFCSGDSSRVLQALEGIKIENPTPAHSCGAVTSSGLCMLGSEWKIKKEALFHIMIELPLAIILCVFT